MVETQLRSLFDIDQSIPEVNRKISEITDRNLELKRELQKMTQIKKTNAHLGNLWFRFEYLFPIRLAYNKLSLSYNS